MRRWLGSAAGAAIVFAAGPTLAQESDALAARINDLEALIAAQQRQIAAQKEALDAQEVRLKAQENAINALRNETLAGLRGTGENPDAPISAGLNGRGGSGNVELAQVARPANPTPAPNPDSPKVVVGEAPPPTQAVEVAALPKEVGVLTPRGSFILEPAFRYLHGSANRLVFRGVEIVTGLQIGLIEANDADRDTIQPSLSFRFGLTNRLEGEILVPYLDRSDTVTTVAQRDESVTRTFSLTGDGIGDVEAGLRWQINQAKPGKPVLIAQLRYKSDTGKGPYDVDYDEFGVARSLATGTGFPSIQTGLSFLYPTDPVVLFGGVTYIYTIDKNVDRTIGDVEVGKVKPGDAFSLNAGFGFAVNPEFSFSLGYEHTHIEPTISYLNGTKQKSQALEVGDFAFNWSLRLTPRLTLNNSYQIGVTSDAPSVAIGVRLPYRF